jgi:hypothetical protein
MVVLILLALLGISITSFLHGLLKTNWILRFPFWGGIVFLVFITFPLIGIEHEGSVVHGSVLRFSFIALLCLIGIFVGDYWAQKVQIPPQREKEYPEELNAQNLNVFIFLYCTVGFYCYWRIRTMFYSGESVMTGHALLFNFFVNLLVFSIVLLAVNFNLIHWIIRLEVIILGGTYFFGQIVFFGRRQTMMILFFLLMLTAWFRWHQLPRRKWVIVGIVVGFVVIFSIGEYRNAVGALYSSQAKSIGEISFINNVWIKCFKPSPEVMGGILVTDATAHAGEFDMGTFHWNRLVFNFVPKQLVGSEFKQSLMIGNANIKEMTDYEISEATTLTGVTDSFVSFGYFGFIKFIIVAFCMGYWLRLANAGSRWYQTLYILMFVYALHTITHNTNWFLSPLVMVLLCCYPVYRIANKKKSRRGNPFENDMDMNNRKKESTAL